MTDHQDIATLQQQQQLHSVALSSAYQNNMKMLNQMLLQQQQQQQNYHDVDAPFFQVQATSVFMNNNNNLFSVNPKSNLDNLHQCVTQAAFLTQPQDFAKSSNDQFQVPEHITFSNMGSNEVSDNGSDAGSNGNGTTENRFRHYQADAWTSMLEELIDFRRKNGQCNVPHTSKELPALGRWVKRQRYQYKLMQEGKKESTMTPERAQILEKVGFVWDAHGSTWHRRFKELHAFYLMQGHCNVPSNYAANLQLSTWVKFQRRQYKALRNGGKPKTGGASGKSLTPVRIRALEELGFQWELRKNRSIKYALKDMETLDPLVRRPLL